VGGGCRRPRKRGWKGIRGLDFFNKTAIIAPMTTKSHEYPSRHKIVFQDKTG
jgi:hypothetical protein